MRRREKMRRRIRRKTKSKYRRKQRMRKRTKIEEENEEEGEDKRRRKKIMRITKSLASESWSSSLPDLDSYQSLSLSPKFQTL